MGSSMVCAECLDHEVCFGLLIWSVLRFYETGCTCFRIVALKHLLLCASVFSLQAVYGSCWHGLSHSRPLYAAPFTFSSLQLAREI